MAVQRKMADLVASIPASNRWKADREIDFENTDIRGRTIPQHLGRIAAEMTNWEDTIADLLGLTATDRADIMEKYSRKPSLQRREALSIWKSHLGSQATYRALMEVFVGAGRMDYAKSVVEILKEGAEMTDTPQARTAETAAATPPTVPSSSGSVGASAGGRVQGTAAATPALQAQTPGNTSTNTGGGGISPRFSPSMTPDQLAQWLLQEYGEAYKNDIGKMKDGLINGELFLELPDDKELLDDLKLSPAFKRLVKKKASQLKESSSASAPVPIPASSGESSLPQPETTMHIPMCSTADLDEADVRSGTVEPDSMDIDEVQGDVLSAWVPKNALWNKKELAVKFLNDVPPQWTYAGSGMNVGNIMSWANEWYLRGGGTVPKFTRVQDASAPSDIRVMFTSNGRTETMIGKKATRAKYTEPTMWLDLHSNSGLDDDYKKHLVVHEFGHALGLGHEHQRSDFWKLIKPYVDIEKMKKYLNVTDKGFKTNWDSESQFKRGKYTAYDPYSVMHYWFKKDWLINGYNNQSKVEKDRDSGALPSDVAQALLGVHLRSSIPLADKPSDMDIQLLKDLYGNTSCTILGPPQQPEIPLLQPKVPCLNRIESDDSTLQQGKPVTLRLLGNLKTKSNGRINIIQQVAPHWHDFATNLDFDPNGTTMQTIEQKYRYDPEACCRETMQLWLKGMGRQPATFELLVEILTDCNLIVLAQNVKEAIPYN